MPYAAIRYAVADRIATITLHRPQARNAFTAAMADEIADALRAADRDDDVRVVVLTGEGENFCVGADLGGGGFAHPDAPPADARSPHQADAWREPATRVTLPMYELTKPVIAAVRGAAVGVGSTMLLPADYRLAGTDTRFGFVFSRRGIYPEAGSAWFLPRLVGMGRATDWLVSGRLVGADEALAAGLVHALHDPAEVLERAYDLARELIATTAPVSVAVIRQTLLRMSGEPTPYPQFDLDSLLIGSVDTSADAAEGVASFLEKRPPVFPGRVSCDLPGFLPWSEP